MPSLFAQLDAHNRVRSFRLPKACSFQLPLTILRADRLSACPPGVRMLIFDWFARLRRVFCRLCTSLAKEPLVASGVVSGAL